MKITNSVIHETILLFLYRTRGNYGDERFTYSMSLVFAMCVANYLYALIMSKVVMAEQAQDTTPTKYYAMCAFTYLTAMVASNKALMWVNYPTQVIGKSCKPIPVMILGVLIGNFQTAYHSVSKVHFLSKKLQILEKLEK